MGASINESNFLMKMKNTNNFCSVLPLLCKTKIEKLCSVKEISTKYNIVLVIYYTPYTQQHLISM